MRDVQPPIFINGNILILKFNFVISIILILKKFFFSKKSKKNNPLLEIDQFTIFSSILVSILSSVLFWSIGPTIIDRSISVNILEILNQANHTLEIDQISESFSRNYLSNNYQINKRLEEQIYLSNVVKEDQNKYKISNKGKMISRINNFISDFYNLDYSILEIN